MCDTTLWEILKVLQNMAPTLRTSLLMRFRTRGDAFCFRLAVVWMYSGVEVSAGLLPSLLSSCIPIAFRASSFPPSETSNEAATITGCLCWLTHEHPCT